MYEDPEWELYFKSMLFGEKYIKFYERVWNQQKQAERLVIIFAQVGLVVGSYESIRFQRSILDKTMTKYDHYDLSNEKEDFRCYVMRCIVSVTTFLTIIFIIRRVRINVEQYTLDQKIRKKQTIGSAKMLKGMLAEIFIILIHCPPGLNAVLRVKQESVFKQPEPSEPVDLDIALNSILNVIMCARIYMVLKMTLIFSNYNSMTARLKCEENQYQFGEDFVIKAELKTNPYLICLFWLVTSVFTLGHMIRLLERTFEHSSGSDWNNLSTSLWYIMITMTTVGYGDYYTHTTFGRIVAILVMIWGAFINSLILVAMQITSEFTAQEQEAYDNQVYIERFHEQQTSAGEFIQAYMFVHNINRDDAGYCFKRLKIKDRRKWFGIIRATLNDWVRIRKAFLVDYNKLDFEKEKSDWEEKMKGFIKKSGFQGYQIYKCEEVITEIEQKQEEMFTALDDIEEAQDNIKYKFEDYAKGKKNPQVLLNKVFKRKVNEIPLPVGDYDFDTNVQDLEPSELHPDIYKEYFNIGYKCTIENDEERGKMVTAKQASNRSKANNSYKNSVVQNGQKGKSVTHSHVTNENGNVNKSQPLSQGDSSDDENKKVNNSSSDEDHRSTLFITNNLRQQQLK